MWKKTTVFLLTLALWGNIAVPALAASEVTAPPPKELALRTYFENAITLQKTIMVYKDQYGGTAGKSRGWTIYQGKKVISPLRLAELAGENDLAQKMKDRRRNLWLWAAGAAGAGLIGGSMINSDNNSGSPLGTGLAIGGFGGALMLIMESFKYDLAPQDAQVLADKYNTNLRQELGLSLKEVRIQ